MSADTATSQPLAARAKPRPTISPWLIAVTVGLAAFMEVLDISIANVALQHIAGSLAASRDEATWVLTSYLVTNAVVLPMSGWLSRAFGRKRFFMSCIAGFSVSSFLCGLAPSLAALIVFRGLQGVTGGGLQPGAQAILADAFPPERRGMAFAVYGIAVVFAPAIGPTLGGWITDNYSWRWVFLVNVPVGIVLLFVTAYVLEELPPRRDRLRFDYGGFILLAIGMCSLQVMLDKGQELDWFSSSLITDLAITAAVSLTSFVIWELLRRDPIVELRLLGRRNFAIANGLMFMLGFVLLGSTALLPLFTQTVLGYTAMQAGMVISPGGFAIMVLMPLVGALVSRVDPRYLLAFGLTATALALYHMTGFNAEVDFATVAWARVYQAVGLSFVFIPINTVAFIGIPSDQNANASALINMMRNLGGSVGISLATTMLARRQQFHQNVLVSHATPLNPQYRAMIKALETPFLIHGGDAVHALKQAQGLLYTLVQSQAAVLSFIDDFWLLATAFIILVPVVFSMRKGVREQRERRSPSGQREP